MKNRVNTLIASVTVLSFAMMSWFVGPLAARGEDASASWNAAKAASYLDGRAVWWSEWSGAARDHGTYCISCHTTLPYALARPRLRAALHQSQPSAAEARIMGNLLTRVTLGRDAEPFYPDQTRGIPKTSESRAIEAVMNALVLARRDAEVGTLSEQARSSLDAMWALQMKVGPNAGAWTWLNFNYEPWESSNSPYLGASLAALAVGAAPGHYAESPNVQGNLGALRQYFQKQFPNESTLNRLMALWASSGVKDLLTSEQRTAAIDEAFAKQQADGGWATALLGTYARVDKTPLDVNTDGYATGLATLSLQAAGVPASSPRVARGLAWLRRHQNPNTGEWAAVSLNKERDPKSDPAKFMTDAATAYAVLALTYSESPSGSTSR
jgi:squalene-hopene/tetraprenyl-beta-curcumene cyclase